MSRKLCNKFIISESIAFNGTNLAVAIPAGSYLNDNRYCLAINQQIPDNTTITAPVVIQIGSTGSQYPLVACDGTQLCACDIGYRIEYPVVVETSATSGVFRVQGCTCCIDRDLSALSGSDA